MINIRWQNPGTSRDINKEFLSRLPTFVSNFWTRSSIFVTFSSTDFKWSPHDFTKKPKWDLFSVLDKSYARYSKSKCTWRFAGFSHYQSKCIPFFIGLLVVIHDGLLGMMTNFLLQDVDPKLPQMLDTFAAYLKK